MHKHERLLRANSTCLQAQRRLQVDTQGGGSETEVCRHRLTSEQPLICIVNVTTIRMLFTQAWNEASPRKCSSKAEPFRSVCSTRHHIIHTYSKRTPHLVGEERSL